jgi:hypothetical protein
LERQVDGYVFYHMQDTEGACAGGHLYLAYGATSDDPGQARRVGERVVEALRRAGLTAEWDGDPSRRIGVRLEWRRRRT